MLCGGSAVVWLCQVEECQKVNVTGVAGSYGVRGALAPRRSSIGTEQNLAGWTRARPHASNGKDNYVASHASLAADFISLRPCTPMRFILVMRLYCCLHWFYEFDLCTLAVHIILGAGFL